MGAIQPFISGAISKTVNMPESATVDDVAEVYRRRLEARRQGDRDLPRQLQGRPAAVGQGRQGPGARSAPSARPERRRAPAPPPAGRPHRDRPQVPRRRVRGLHPRRRLRRRHPGRHLPRHREGRHDARRPDELVHDLRLARPPVRRAARGVRLEVLAHALRAVAALTNDPDIRVAKSIVDYVFRWMGKKFLTVDQQEEIGILSPEVRARMAQAYAAGAPEPPTLDARARPADARADGALQRARGLDRVLPLRRPDGARRHLLHLPRLRHVDRLRLGRSSDRHRAAAARSSTGAVPVRHHPPSPSRRAEFS